MSIDPPPRSAPPLLIVRVAALLETQARRPIALFLVAVALFVYGANVCLRRMGDYDVYHRAATRLVEGEPLYRLGDPHRYLYAPVFPFLFVPLAPLPIVPGKVVWYLVNLWLAVAVVRRSIRMAWPEGRAPPGFALLLVAFSLRFLDNNIAHGQINLLMIWLILEAYALAERSRFTLAGFALAAAIQIKLFPGVLLIQLALRRQWRFLASTIVAGAAIFLLPALWWGTAYPQVVSGWLSVVVDQATHYDMANKINQSISAFVYRLFVSTPEGSPLVELPRPTVTALTLLIHLAFLGSLAVFSTRLARRGAAEPAGPGAEELSLYLLYATVLSPYSWKYYFVDLVPAFAVALRRLWSGHDRIIGWGLAAVFALNFLPGQRLFGKQVGVLFQLYSFHFVATALLFVLVYRSREFGFTSRNEVC